MITRTQRTLRQTKLQTKPQVKPQVKPLQEKIRVALADDHALVIEGLRNLINQQADMQVVASVNNGDELLVLLQHRNDIDVVILDLQMPYSGTTVLSELRQRDNGIPILVLTAFADGESIQSSIELGADGFAPKTESPTQTIDAIRQVAQGRLVFPRSARRWMSSHGRSLPKENDPKLSAREQEVLENLARGLPNIEIARSLVISENTVRFHLKNIYSKLDITNRTEAVAWYFQNKR